MPKLRRSSVVVPVHLRGASEVQGEGQFDRHGLSLIVSVPARCSHLRDIDISLEGCCGEASVLKKSAPNRLIRHRPEAERWDRGPWSSPRRLCQVWTGLVKVIADVNRQSCLPRTDPNCVTSSAECILDLPIRTPRRRALRLFCIRPVGPRPSAQTQPQTKRLPPIQTTVAGPPAQSRVWLRRSRANRRLALTICVAASNRGQSHDVSPTPATAEPSPRSAIARDNVHRPKGRCSRVCF